MFIKTSKTGFSRRDFLKASALGALGLQFASNALAKGVSAATSGKTKSVIEIWLWGGPCHLDTFDPKPDAGANYCGPLNSPIETNVSGMRIGQLLPNLAQQADKYSLVRSLTHGVNAHETATYQMQTGRAPGDGQVYPSMGAVISKLNGYDKNYKGILPPYVVMTKTHGRFSEEGFFGSKYKPFSTGGDPSAERFAVEGIISKQVSDKRQLKRRELLDNLDTFGGKLFSNTAIEQMELSEKEAYELILGDAREIFNLKTEPEKLRKAYGMNKFGQSCLQARRLVEAGVPYITVNFNGWDTHKGHFNSMNQMLPQLDQGLATLLQDLSQRGLLDNTIVWCSGEFGRTPRVQWEQPWNGGRSHFGHCFSGLIAGGGFKGGQVVGESNATGEEVRERPVYPQDWIGSIYQMAGIDPKGTIQNSAGEQVPLILPTQGSGLLTEIM